MKNKNYQILILLLTIISLSACAVTSQPMWNDLEARTTKLDKNSAYNAVTMALVDKGFDIKMGNKDLGLITTEFKKYAAYGDDPPFDLYLQIKARISERPDGKISIKLTPLAKDVNRLNSAAFTEHELYSFTEEQISRPKGLNAYYRAALNGHLLFLNVAQSIAESSGLDMTELEQNIRQIAEK